MHGKGTYFYRNGRKYEGQWVAGYKQGHGVFTWPNGDSYEGDFHLDKCNGISYFLLFTRVGIFFKP